MVKYVISPQSLMKVLCLLILTLAAFVAVRPQEPASIDKVLVEARKQTIAYREAFANLVGDELKTCVRFNGRGEIKKRSTVRSELLVYQSGKSNGSAELRVVFEVDGKPVPDAKRRSEKLLEELSKTTTSITELDKLQRESTRYDKSTNIYGVTLNQATVLSPNLRGAIRFETAGTDLIDGRPVFVVKYLQTRPDPLIAFNPSRETGAYITINTNLPKQTSPDQLRLRGTLWVDRDTYQIRREVRDVIIDTDGSQPLLSSLLDYTVSDFGILLPKRIAFVFNDVERKDGRLTVTSKITADFEYSKFRRTNVEITITDSDS